jgi:hypothetical protein
LKYLSGFFSSCLDEKVLLLLVVYEKYNSLLSINFNAGFYKFSLTEKIFSKYALLLTFFQSLNQIQVCLTSILNNINQYLLILPTENIFILVILFT